MPFDFLRRRKDEAHGGAAGDGSDAGSGQRGIPFDGMTEEWRLVGTIEKAELLPEGVLHVAGSRVTGGKEARARLLIDFNAATDKGERSYLGHASANCENDSIRIYFRQTFSEYGANGWRVSEGPIEPELLVQHPQAPLRDAVKLICE